MLDIDILSCYLKYYLYTPLFMHALFNLNYKNDRNHFGQCNPGVI